MARHKDKDHAPSRRNFLKGMRWTPVLFLPAPLYKAVSHTLFEEAPAGPHAAFDLADFRVSPHYPAKSPLEDVLRRVAPGADEYLTEKYAFEVKQSLDEWSRALRERSPALSVLAKFLSASLEASSLVPVHQATLRSENGIEVIRRRFATTVDTGHEKFLQEIKTYLAAIVRIETAEFEITSIEKMADPAPAFKMEIRYDLVGAIRDGGREQRVGHWLTRWSRTTKPAAGAPCDGRRRKKPWLAPASRFSSTSPPRHSARRRRTRKQMLRGVDHWRTVMDGACGIDVYGNNGLAVGDFDNDGFDDLYVCQPAGLAEPPLSQSRRWHVRGRDGTIRRGST